MPLARLVPAGVDRRGQPTRARIVVYRRPLEVRARDGADLADLVHDVLVEQVAAYLGLDPDVVDGESLSFTACSGSRSAPRTATPPPGRAAARRAALPAASICTSAPSGGTTTPTR